MTKKTSTHRNSSIQPQPARWQSKVVTRLNNVVSSPEKTFIIIASIFGIAMMLLMPILMVPDETAHFYRAYQIGEGKLLSEVRGSAVGGHVPKIPNMQASPNDGSPVIPYGSYSTRVGEQFVKFHNSATYNPIAYIPQAVGIDLGRVVSDSIGAIILSGRFVSLSVYILLVAIAIKIARKGKWVYATAGLLPMSIQQAASLSPDGMIIGLTFITIASLHNLFLSQEKIKKAQYITLIALVAFLVILKQINVLFLVPLIFLQKKLFGTNLKKYTFFIIAVVTCIIVMLGWMILAKHVYGTLDAGPSIGLVNVSPAQQLIHLIKEPLSFVGTLFNTYVYEGPKGVPTSDYFLLSTVGYFSWYTYKLPLSLVLLSYATLLLVLLGTAADKVKDNKRTITVFSGTFLIYVVGVAGALYLIWTTVGAQQVAGIQGRYFIPVIPLLIPLFALIGQHIKVTFDRPYRVGQLVSIVSIVNLSAMLILTYTFFT